jgi:hypothetical protein
LRTELPDFVEVEVWHAANPVSLRPTAKVFRRGRRQPEPLQLG